MGTRTPMSAQDALWLTMDRPNNLMIIDGVMILTGNPGFDAVLDVVRTRVSGRYPVFRRRPVRTSTSWAWEDDPSFDLIRHVKKVRLKKPADIVTLQRFMSEQRAKPLTKSRPLWVMYVLEDIRLDDGTLGCAIVTRFHHAMADGVRLTQVMLSMCDTDEPAVEATVVRGGNGADLPVPVPGPVADALAVATDTAKALGAGVAGLVDMAGRGAMVAAGQVAAAVTSAVADPAGAVAAAPGILAAAPSLVAGLVRSGAHTVEEGFGIVAHPDRLVDALTLLGNEDNRAVNDVASVTKLLLSSSAHTVWTGQPGTTKAIAWSEPLSLADVKAVGRSQGATVNDILLAAMAGGVQRYLKMHHGRVREIQWMVPVNLKPFADNLPEELGNYFALVMLPMPLGLADPRDRIRQMKAHMERIKHSDEAVLTFGLQRTISASPGQVQFFLTNFFANKAVGVLTNVPGPRGQLRFAGIPVRQVVGFAPCSGDQPMTATIFSYNGTVTVGFATDAGLVADPDVLVGLVAEEAEAMQALLRRPVTRGTGKGTRPARPPAAARPADREPAKRSGPAKPSASVKRSGPLKPSAGVKRSGPVKPSAGAPAPAGAQPPSPAKPAAAAKPAEDRGPAKRAGRKRATARQPASTGQRQPASRSARKAPS